MEPMNQFSLHLSHWLSMRPIIIDSEYRMAKLITELSCSQDGTDVGSFLKPGTRRAEGLMAQRSNALHNPDALESQNRVPKTTPRSEARPLFQFRGASSKIDTPLFNSKTGSSIAPWPKAGRKLETGRPG